MFRTSMARTALYGLALAAAGAMSNSHAIAETNAPELGIYYQRYEPTFYTGFAPRALDPDRIHLQIGRGNQLRTTIVLSDAVLETYVDDIHTRYKVYKDLIRQGQLVLTQNMGFERFEKTVRETFIAELSKQGKTLSAEAIRSRNLAVMRKLNPGRVFEISMPVDKVIANWTKTLRKTDQNSVNRKRQLAVLNALLPTRLYVAELDPAVKKELTRLVRKTLKVKGTNNRVAAIRENYLNLLEKVSGGRYPIKDGAFKFTEFTAIYPIGSFNGYTTYKGQKIPLFPTPGRRALKHHQRTKTVDHIPDALEYSYSPWLPYMHVGTRLHNSFHTLWWKMEPQKASFLPQSLRNAPKDERTGKQFKYLWLLSRGPMSGGCTHVNTGHINELRQFLPAETDGMYEVDVFINKSYLFDVFDIDGDMVPEVMGVKYYHAYSLKDKKPHQYRAPNKRRPFYEWLYGGIAKFEKDGRAYFTDITDAQFIDRNTFKGKTYKKLYLYEAELQPQQLQFYRNKGIPFARKLRKVGANNSVFSN
ncbi:MAG: hypothetical protein ACR2OR_11505 [Hyphomicrobiales bacterium]